MRQYALADRRPGWAGHRRHRGDRWRSGAVGTVGRRTGEGSSDLVARVCLGEVGAVFGLEVSRLARSNADLARLLELAR